MQINVILFLLLRMKSQAMKDIRIHYVCALYYAIYNELMAGLPFCQLLSANYSVLKKLIKHASCS